MAEPAQRDDQHADTRPCAAALAPAYRRRIGEALRDAALGEHASIAAFARFVLDLLALAAPAELVAEAPRAMADEIVHAQLAFSRASAYLGTPIGPDVLAADTSTVRGLAEIVCDTIAEGCIGETISVARAEHALAGTEDPAVCERRAASAGIYARAG